MAIKKEVKKKPKSLTDEEEDLDEDGEFGEGGSLDEEEDEAALGEDEDEDETIFDEEEEDDERSGWALDGDEDE